MTYRSTLPRDSYEIKIVTRRCSLAQPLLNEITDTSLPISSAAAGTSISHKLKIKSIVKYIMDLLINGLYLFVIPEPF